MSIFCEVFEQNLFGSKLLLTFELPVRRFSGVSGSVKLKIRLISSFGAMDSAGFHCSDPSIVDRAAGNCRDLKLYHFLSDDAHHLSMR